ncbi:MAG: hypothetical protein NT154_13710 [Verrucomicrobia bacterium]|nr:hypothetical protein [Verrucomicrobiota bacterium]
MSIDEIETQLRKFFGPVQRNTYRRLYAEAKTDTKRWAACESMAGWAYTRLNCTHEEAHEAVRRIIVEPLEPLTTESP